MTDLHGRQVRAQRLGLRSESYQGRLQVVAGRGNVGTACPAVRRSGDRQVASDRIVEGRDVDGRSAVLVHRDRKIVAAEQIDAVKAGVAGKLIDLRQQSVELARERRAHGSIGSLLGLADQRLC